MTALDWKSYVREVADFPEPGVGFKDITPLMQDGVALRAAGLEDLQALAETAQELSQLLLLRNVRRLAH